MDAISLFVLFIVIAVPVIAIVAIVRGIKRLFTSTEDPVRQARRHSSASLTGTISREQRTQQPPHPSRARQQFRPASPDFRPITLEFTLHDLPRDLGIINVRGTGYSDNTYQIDISTLSCTCTGGQLRAAYPANDPRRICHHLMPKLKKRGLIHGGDDWAKALIDLRESVPIKAWILRLTSAPDILVTTGTNEEWLNVFARRKRPGERIAEASGPIERHGWSLVETRWAFGTGPPGAGEARRLLAAATK